LAQTTPENIASKDFSINPLTRYTNYRTNSKFEIKKQIKHLLNGFDSIEQSNEQSMASKRARRATVALTTRDFHSNDFQSNDLQSPLEVKRIEKTIEEEKVRDNNNTQPLQSMTSSMIAQKADWLLGTTRDTFDSLLKDGNNRQSIESKDKKKEKNKSIDIVERAINLEKILTINENSFEPKLQKVGKIEENDWNFRVWNENSLFGL
jgi:hypothetical protein